MSKRDYYLGKALGMIEFLTIQWPEKMPGGQSEAVWDFLARVESDETWKGDTIQ